jgi:hypothetical protein
MERDWVSPPNYQTKPTFFDQPLKHLYRTILSSAGNDGRVRLWKATSRNVWRPAGSVGVEQAEEGTEQSEQKDVEMES